MKNDPLLVFLHGWGQSSKIWSLQKKRLAHHFRLLTLELPGHGQAPDLPVGQWRTYLSQQLPREPFILIGWSLGGMLAIQLALEPHSNISGLVLVATTPRFCSACDWPHGCSDDMLDGFRQSVAQSSIKALSSYFSLMFLGDTLSRSDYNHLAREVVDRKHLPGQGGLEKGLELLAMLDLRKDIQRVKTSCLVIHGESDRIIPAGAGRFLAESMADAELAMFPDCGHAPFLTYPEKFDLTLEAWCRNRLSDKKH
jgi:pimeloyl-[acyl-carrier protein] methyl ester esterase